MGSVRWAVLEIAAPSAAIQLYIDPPTEIFLLRSSYGYIEIPIPHMLYSHETQHYCCCCCGTDVLCHLWEWPGCKDLQVQKQGEGVRSQRGRGGAVKEN